MTIESESIHRGGSLGNRVVIEDGRAVAVEVESGGAPQRVYGRRVTLSAGALASPAILMRSGIGPRAELERHGIMTLIDAPGVGANLIDHNFTRLANHADNGDRRIPGGTAHFRRGPDFDLCGKTSRKSLPQAM
jgi:choline dehydrogenase-like flavoprotein